MYVRMYVCNFQCSNCSCACVEERERKRRSQAVQRNLPRPSDINSSALRGGQFVDHKHKAIFEAEEMVKEEMVAMLRHDLVHHPTPLAAKNKSAQSARKKELEAHPLEKFTDEELAKVGHDCMCVCTRYVDLYVRMYVYTYCVCVPVKNVFQYNTQVHAVWSSEVVWFCTYICMYSIYIHVCIHTHTYVPTYVRVNILHTNVLHLC